MQFGIVIIDAQTHTMLEANPKALEMIGGTGELVLGSVCHRFICPAELGKCPVTDLSQTVDSSERVLLNLRGEKIPIVKSVIKTMLGGKEVLIESFIDITDRKGAEDTLLRVNKKLNVLSQLTRKDLTSQTFVLSSYLELVKNQLAGQDHIIDTLEKGFEAVRTIQDTIEYSKDYQDMGAKPPKWQNVNMALLLGLSHISIGNIRNSIETGNLEIFADPLLEKVCQCLFENSVKHGEHVTHIRVWHTITPDGATIFFEDDGIGIPHEKKEQIFLRSEGTSASRGSLIFVREILDITGITIRETGEPGKGAQFEITVPKGMWRSFSS
jgi:signal transduction histidine kinase